MIPRPHGQTGRPSLTLPQLGQTISVVGRPWDYRHRSISRLEAIDPKGRRRAFVAIPAGVPHPALQSGQTNRGEKRRNPEGPDWSQRWRSRFFSRGRCTPKRFGETAPKGPTRGRKAVDFVASAKLRATNSGPIRFGKKSHPDAVLSHPDQSADVLYLG